MSYNLRIIEDTLASTIPSALVSKEKSFPSHLAASLRCSKWQKEEKKHVITNSVGKPTSK